MKSYPDFHKQMCDPFHQLCRINDKIQVFDTLMDFILWQFTHKPTLGQLEKIVCRLAHPNRLNLLIEIEKIVITFQNKMPLRDHLGYFYSMECASKSAGQFFTSDDVANLQAQLLNPGISDCPFGATVLDPTCGSGSLLLGVARLNRNLLFHGSDLSDRCCKMALFNLISNQLVGEICHLNCLTNEFFHTYIIVLGEDYNGNKRLCFIKSLDKNDSIIHLKTLEECKKATAARIENPKRLADMAFD